MSNDSLKSGSKSARARDVFRAYIHEARRHGLLLALVIVGSIGIQASDLAVPLFLRQLFNILASYRPDPNTVHQLFMIIGAIAAVYFGGWIARRTQVYSIINLESR